MKDAQNRQITIKEAVENLEEARGSTVISCISDSRAIFDHEDCITLDNNLSELMGESQEKIKRLDLFLQSPGGILEAAYKFLRICKEYSEEFNVIVPLSAKSAATAICLGADEIVMTKISELGPVDPIIQHPQNPGVRVPARSIKEYIDLVSNPEESDFRMSQELKDSLNTTLDAYLIGSYEMSLKNSKEIIEKLLQKNKKAGLSQDEINTATREFTEGHASHSYPIDRGELIDLGFKNITKAEDSPTVIRAIRELFTVYAQFMKQNNFVKLQGNRHNNRHVQLNRPQKVSTKSIPDPVSFS